MDIIRNRRSIRKYRQGCIPNEDITRMLQAAMRAPSAGNEQPWEFIVMRDKLQMKKITEFHPYASMVKEADSVIVVCGNTKRQKYPYDFWIQDCSAATQNLLLEAEYLGIGAVWLGIHPITEREEGMRALLALPAYVVPLAAIALGYPEEKAPPLDTYLPERVHQESWEKRNNVD